MSVIAVFTVPADQFALGEILEVRPGVQVRLESMVPTGDRTVPYFWVSKEDTKAVEQTLTDSSMVERVRIVDETNDETLFKMEWSSEVNGLIEVVGKAEAAVLEAQGYGDDWSFRVRFSEHEALSAFYRSCIDRGIDVDLNEVNSPLGSDGERGIGLTDAQREALLAALEHGYFAVPRQTTLEELAETLDISDTAVSQRIRRGLTAVLSVTFLQGEDRS